MKQTLHIKGMTCTNCALSVEKQLKKSGLKEVEVNFIRGEARFENSANIPVSLLEKELSSIGFEVVQDHAHHSPSSGFGIRQKLILSALFTLPLLAHMVLSTHHLLSNPWVQFSLSLPVYLIGARHFGKSAWGSLKGGMPNMDVLIFIGSSAAFFYSLIGTMLYPEHAHEYMFYETAATIITLVLLGNYIEERAVAKTGESTKELYDMQPKKVTVMLQGKRIQMKLKDVKIGDLIQLRQGDYVPVDGYVEENKCTLDMRFLTGESEPMFVAEGQAVKSGSLILEGNIVMKASKLASQSTLSEIIQVVEDAQGDKPAIQRLGDRISAVFVPVVVSISFITFAAGHWVFGIELEQALMRAIAVLVISCPCAMGLAAPTAVVVGFGRAARSGILLKKGSTLETLAQAEVFVFDKTGTLTTDRMKVIEIKHLQGDEQANLSIVKAMAARSSHPISRSIYHYLEECAPASVNNIHEEQGSGIHASDPVGRKFFLGRSANSSDIELTANGEVMCSITLQEEIKQGAEDMVARLKKSGSRIIMLSGDHEEKCEAVAAELGIEEFYSRQTPLDKIAKVRNWAKENKVVMVGDGINDAAALAQAHVAISMSGATGIAQQNAQIILMHKQDMLILTKALEIGKHTMITIKQNFFWAFAYNVVAIPIAALGFLSPMVAALSMAFSDVVVVGNSLRLRWKNIH